MKETLITMLEELENDIDYEIEDEDVFVTIEDFDGFDEDYSEIMRELDNPKGVKNLLVWLEENGVKGGQDFYNVYQFDGFYVQVGYASFDI